MSKEKITIKTAEDILHSRATYFAKRDILNLFSDTKETKSQIDLIIKFYQIGKHHKSWNKFIEKKIQNKIEMFIEKNQLTILEQLNFESSSKEKIERIIGKSETLDFGIAFSHEQLENLLIIVQKILPPKLQPSARESIRLGFKNNKIFCYEKYEYSETKTVESKGMEHYEHTWTSTETSFRRVNHELVTWTFT